jgi:hypothetical protein
VRSLLPRLPRDNISNPSRNRYSLRRIEYALYPMPDLFEGDEYEAEDSSPILDSAAADEPAAELPADVVA